MATKKYRSGTFCIDIACPHHKVLEPLDNEAYLARRRSTAEIVTHGSSIIWLEKHNYRVILPLSEISAKELSARLKGIDPLQVEDLTIDEILTL